MAIEATAVQSLWQACDAWLRRADEIISASAAALNAINVFPVSDADTGSNLKLTLRGIVSAVPTFDRANLDAVAQAAILSAHGNSGAILAEMMTSVCRALEQDADVAGSAPGPMMADLLRRVASAATQAVARPVEGTILTVADAAATAAEQAALLDDLGSRRDGALVVALAGQQGARTALQHTPDQLDVLAQAGVVDAGGQAYVLLLDVLVEILGGPPAVALAEAAPAPAHPARPARVPPQAEFEVMYALRGASRSTLDALRDRLSELGHSVVIVGDAAVAQVHVHLAEPGSAVEAGLDAGRLSQITITALPTVWTESERGVVSMVAGPGLAEAVRRLGGVPVQGAHRLLTLDELTTAMAETCGDVVILPNDMENLELATHLASTLRTDGRRIAVIPTVAQVQGLAAIAVHEPTTDFDSAVVAMSTAAAHTRHGAVTIAESSAMTMAGRCQPGDVLGLVEGDFVEIGTSVTDVAWRVLLRLLATGGELVTLVSGVDAAPELLPELARRTHAAQAGVDVELVLGGQRRYHVLIGVE